MRFRIAAGFLLVLCGCISTHHVEYQRAATTAVDSSGGASCSSQASQDERHWQGPWLGQPDRIRP